MAEHVVPMPRWSGLVGIARLVIALLVLIFVATAAGLGSHASYAAFGLTLFTASATLIIFGYYSISLCRKPQIYNAWAVLGLEILGVIFWLVSFSLCAEWTAAFNHDWYFGNDKTFGGWKAPFNPDDLKFDVYKRDVVERSTAHWKASIGLMGTAAGLGALEFCLFVVTLVFFSISLHKHRVAGKPLVYGGFGVPQAATIAAPPAPAAATTPESSTEKEEQSGETAEDTRKEPEQTGKTDASAIV